VYRDHVTVIDDGRLAAWNDTLGILLVFVSVQQMTAHPLNSFQAGLFSAICTAFIIEVYKSLETDWQKATAFTVYAIWSHLNDSTPAGFIVPDPNTFTASASVYWTNGLWFGSLSLSLAASLLAILARQWLGEYRSRVHAHAQSVRHWAGRHMRYSEGLDKWHLDAVIATLPVLLHAALFMFLAGLSLWLWKLDLGMCIALTTFTLITVILYALTTLLPLWFESCPTATPLLTQSQRMFRALRGRIVCSRIWTWLDHRVFRRTSSRRSPAENVEQGQTDMEFEPVPTRQRRRSADDDQERVKILVHMIRRFPDPQDVEVAMQAIAGLHPMSSDLLGPLKPLAVPIASRIRVIDTPLSDTGMRRLSTSLRTMCALQANLSDAPFEDSRAVADAAAEHRTYDSFAIRVALDLLHVTEWPNTNFQILDNELIEWFLHRTGYDAHPEYPILPETACRLLLAIQQQPQWQCLFNIASIPLGMMAALSLCVDSEYSTDSFGEPLQTLLPEAVSARTFGDWVPTVTSSWRGSAAEAWGYVLGTTQEYMIRHIEEKWTIWQAYFGILAGFRTHQQERPRTDQTVAVSTAEFDKMLSPWASPRALLYEPTSAAVDGIVSLCHCMLDADHTAWSKVVSGTYFNIFYIYREQQSFSSGDTQKVAIRLLAHLTPMPSNVWRRAPQTTNFWTPQGENNEIWIRNSIMNLLHNFQPDGGVPISFWKLLVDLPVTDLVLDSKNEPGLGSDYRYSVAMALLIKIVHLFRNGVNISTYADALLQNRWCEDLLLRPDSRDGDPSGPGAVQFAQHAREIHPEWWTGVTGRLLNSCDRNHLTARNHCAAFIERVEQAGQCTGCPDRITPRMDLHDLLAVHREDINARSPTPPPPPPAVGTLSCHP